MSKITIKRFTIKSILIYSFAFVVILIFFYALFLSYFQNRIFPGVKISGIELGGQTKESAYSLLSSEFQKRQNNPLKISHQGKELSIKLEDTLPQINLNEKVAESYILGRSGNFPQDLTSQALALTSYLNLPQPSSTLFSPSGKRAKKTNSTDLKLTLSYQKRNVLESSLTDISRSVKVDATNAKIIPDESLTIIPSKEGIQLDKELLLQQLESYLTLTSEPPVSLPTKTTSPSFNTKEAEIAKKALETVTNSPIKLRYDQSVWTIDQPTLFTLLDLTHKKVDNNNNQLVVDTSKLATFLNQLSQTIDQEAKDARFTFDPASKKVNEFQAAQEGRVLDIQTTAVLITQSLTSNNPQEITLPVKVTRPKINTAEINSFGIEELIAQGVSHFSGSIDNRIYNIKLAASKINGVLIAPGENFSFNDTIGDISAATGFKQAYVIKSGRTVLDDGGGVCQVSTTVFRAALNAGVPITERTAHAYRVGYYEIDFPPGLDATIFHPSVDFKFKNDTPGYILVQSHVQGSTLYVDLYGTKDGRTVNLTKPQILSQTPPLPELRQDDPNLPKGTVKQVDWPAWGAKVVFNRTVIRAGEEIIKETFTSNYRPWQAVYLVGTRE